MMGTYSLLLISLLEHIEETMGFLYLPRPCTRQLRVAYHFHDIKQSGYGQQRGSMFIEIQAIQKVYRKEEGISPHHETPIYVGSMHWERLRGLLDLIHHLFTKDQHRFQDSKTS